MRKLLYIFMILPVFAGVACSKVLDKHDLSTLGDEEVWNDYSLADGFMARIALETSPVWESANSSKNCDEADGGSSNSVAYGAVTSSDLKGLDYWRFAQVREINIALEKLDAGGLTADQKNMLSGQAHFWRAYVYFEMVKRYGGVPIIKKAQELGDDLMIPRNKTSECFDFIIDELNQAITKLPVKFAETGKINRAVAFAFKGKVLLYRASPQFNPSGTASLWTDAYNTDKIAYDSLKSYGYALYENFNDLWLKEMNKEDIFVTRFNDPERVSEEIKFRRPNSEATGVSAAVGGSPTQELVEAFPMADGKGISGNPQYNAQKYWENRDPRFAGTIVYNAKLWELSGKKGRIQYTYYGYTPDGYGTPFGTTTGYYTCKAVDPAPTAATATKGAVDWVEMRFAEVMMNYAEAANEAGHTEVAYDMLTQIRKRAGISPGIDNLYGLTAGQDKAAMRETLMNERYIEFAYENKRFWDLRRVRWLNRLTGTRRHGLSAKPVDANDLSKGFISTIVIVDTKQAFDLPDKYYFLPISRDEILKNTNLKQTSGWDTGDFDPLQ